MSVCVVSVGVVSVGVEHRMEVSATEVGLVVRPLPRVVCNVTHM